MQKDHLPHQSQNPDLPDSFKTAITLMKCKNPLDFQSIFQNTNITFNLLSFIKNYDR